MSKTKAEAEAIACVRSYDKHGNVNKRIRRVILEFHPYRSTKSTLDCLDSSTLHATHTWQYSKCKTVMFDVPSLMWMWLRLEVLSLSVGGAEKSAICISLWLELNCENMQTPKNLVNVLQLANCNYWHQVKQKRGMGRKSLINRLIHSLRLLTRCRYLTEDWWPYLANWWYEWMSYIVYYINQNLQQMNMNDFGDGPLFFAFQVVSSAWVYIFLKLLLLN
jgi:hypothetical protein